MAGAFDLARDALNHDVRVQRLVASRPLAPAVLEAATPNLQSGAALFTAAREGADDQRPHEGAQPVRALRAARVAIRGVAIVRVDHVRCRGSGSGLDRDAVGLQLERIADGVHELDGSVNGRGRGRLRLGELVHDDVDERGRALRRWRAEPRDGGLLEPRLLREQRREERLRQHQADRRLHAQRVDAARVLAQPIRTPNLAQLLHSARNAPRANRGG
jgi:hypothetical protein